MNINKDNKKQKINQIRMETGLQYKKSLVETISFIALGIPITLRILGIFIKSMNQILYDFIKFFMESDFKLEQIAYFIVPVIFLLGYYIIINNNKTKEKGLFIKIYRNLTGMSIVLPFVFVLLSFPSNIGEGQILRSVLITIATYVATYILCYILTRLKYSKE